MDEQSGQPVEVAVESNATRIVPPDDAASLTFTIYCHRHVASGRCYVGQTLQTTQAGFVRSRGVEIKAWEAGVVAGLLGKVAAS